MVKKQIIELLNLLGFRQDGNVYTKKYDTALHPLQVDVEKERIYYENSGITVNRSTTSNFSEDENLVVLECVDRLLSKGYHANHIELEPHWKLGHGTKGGYADIWVRTYTDNAFDGNDDDKNSLLIIECKTSGAKFNEAWNDTLDDGAQLFSYFQQEPATKFLCLYTSDIVDGKVLPEYKLINVQDNQDLLESDKNAQSYQNKNDKQRYRVWRDTYSCEYATRGLFEDDIRPYEIGKNKYTVADLVEVNNEEIQKKYHEFALILRQHNVSGRENAFDKLVNLFLAKVVDETNNPENLHFYWKGTAYDDDFQLQDRLQRLYRDGMMRFLNEEVTYIENSQIDLAFRRFKNDPDATKKTIMEYFRALKFFSDNDFSFISVHNEKLFRQNAVVLRKMVKMLQDIRLKTDQVNQNQFLGDLFEGFLNRGIKQSEGQFFTPMPIVRFLVSSLPLEHIVRDNEDIPWAIDYACGAGHFLTEYAVRIKEFVEKYRKDIPLKEYYSRITGIEKEYRLSKVSKVSAFMYGQDDIKIVYADALVKHADVKDGQYEVLVANPPYSVSGFLDTLTEEQRKCYSLYNDDLNTDKCNAIEAFFIERAAQLMKSGGVAGIILPVSVLNRNGIHAHAREIILKCFDIVALAEFGSGTFGQTGTNTVTMFLRRKETNTSDADHYKNRVNSWFAQRDETNAVYQDEYLLGLYCNHCGYQLDDYKTFIGGVINDGFLNTETVQAYYASFFGNQRNAMKDVCDEAKTIRNKYLSRANTRTYKQLPLVEQNQIKEKAFLDFVTAIEKEKVYYFVLAHAVAQPVLLIKSPTSTSDVKKFLGYGWSDSKGNEGIQYLNVGKAKSSDDEDGEDDDTMSQIRGIDGVQTPLFNPANLFDDDKINTLIRKNFMGEEVVIPKNLEAYVTKGHLVDMLDFTRTSFTKEFKTVIVAHDEIESQWPLVKLKNACKDIVSGGDKPKNFSKERTSSLQVPVYANGVVNDGLQGFTDKAVINEPCVTISARGTLGFCAYHEIPFVPIVRLIVVTPNEKVDVKYLYYVLSKVNFVNEGSSTPQLSVPKVAEYKIPLPPIDVQKKIAEECEKIERQKVECLQQISQIQEQKESLFVNAQEHADKAIRLDSSCFEVTIGRRVLKNEVVKDGSFDIYSANVFEPFGKTDHSVVSDFSKPSVLWGIDGDWMVNCIDKDIQFCPTDHCGVIRVLDERIVFPCYLVYPLKKEGERQRFSRANRASTERIKALTLKVPSVEIQKEVVKKLRKLDEKIKEANQQIANASSAKQAILDKYLK